MIISSSTGHCFIIFIISILAKKMEAMRITNLTVPEVADFRTNLTLDCHFDMGDEDLYAVKWYKDDREFLRFMPHQQPHIMTFPEKGVKIHSEKINCNELRCRVVLGNLTRHLSSGSYKCEISSEAPAFRLASQTRNVTIAGVPSEGPRIDSLSEYYQVGNILTARCISPAANPIPKLSWFINEEKASSDIITEGSSSIPDENGLASKSAWIRFQIEKTHVSNHNILLKCSSTLPDVPLPPSEVSNTVKILPERQERVNNQERYWSHDYSSSNNNRPAIPIFTYSILITCCLFYRL